MTRPDSVKPSAAGDSMTPAGAVRSPPALELGVPPTPNSVPTYLTASAVAKACGVSRRSMIRLLKGAGIAERIGARWLVAGSRLRERLPDVYDRVLQARETGASAPTNDQ